MSSTMDEQILQLGAFTFTRPPYGRVSIGIDGETQIIPRELSTQEAVQLARFLIRDEALLHDIDTQTSTKIMGALISEDAQTSEDIVRALVFGEEQGE